MCEFCLKYGEGEKWYLQAKNCSDDLFSDIRRRKYIEEFVSHPEALAKDAHNIDRLSRLPGLTLMSVRVAASVCVSASLAPLPISLQTKRQSLIRDGAMVVGFAALYVRKTRSALKSA